MPSARMSATRMRGFSDAIRVLEDDLHVACAARAGRARAKRAEVVRRRNARTPAVGRTSCRMRLADRRLAAARLADQRERASRAERRSDTPSTALHVPDHALEHALADRKVDLRGRALRSSGAGARRAARRPRLAGATSATRAGAGAGFAQMTAHRVARRRSASSRGTFGAAAVDRRGRSGRRTGSRRSSPASDGTCRGSPPAGVPRLPRSGSASNSLREYGMLRARGRTPRAAPPRRSRRRTSRPRDAPCSATTPRSWVMSRIDMPRCALQLAQQRRAPAPGW